MAQSSPMPSIGLPRLPRLPRRPGLPSAAIPPPPHPDRMRSISASSPIVVVIVRPSSSSGRRHRQAQHKPGDRQGAFADSRRGENKEKPARGIAENPYGIPTTYREILQQMDCVTTGAAIKLQSNVQER